MGSLEMANPNSPSSWHRVALLDPLPVSPMGSYMGISIIFSNHYFQNCPSCNYGLVLSLQRRSFAKNQGYKRWPSSIFDRSHPPVITGRVIAAAHTLDLPISNLAREFGEPPLIPVQVNISNVRSGTSMPARTHVLMSPMRKNVLVGDFWTTAKNALRNWSSHLSEVIFLILLRSVRLPVCEPLALNALERNISALRIVDADLRAIVLAEIKLREIAIQVLLVHVLVSTHQTALEDRK